MKGVNISDNLLKDLYDWQVNPKLDNPHIPFVMLWILFQCDDNGMFIMDCNEHGFNFLYAFNSLLHNNIVMFCNIDNDSKCELPECNQLYELSGHYQLVDYNKYVVQEKEVIDKIQVSSYLKTGVGPLGKWHTILGEKEGQEVYEQVKHNILAGIKTELDFTGVRLVPGFFLQSAVGQLYRHFPFELVRLNLSIVEMNAKDFCILQAVINDAQQYYRFMNSPKQIWRNNETNNS